MNFEAHGFATSGWNAVPVAAKVIERIAPPLGIEPRLDLPPADRSLPSRSRGKTIRKPTSYQNLVWDLRHRVPGGQYIGMNFRAQTTPESRRPLALRLLLELPPPGGAEGGRWSSDDTVPTFGPRMVCTHCGIVGADARPNWKEQSQRESLTGVQRR